MCISSISQAPDETVVDWVEYTLLQRRWKGVLTVSEIAEIWNMVIKTTYGIEHCLLHEPNKKTRI